MKQAISELNRKMHCTVNRSRLIVGIMLSTLLTLLAGCMSLPVANDDGLLHSNHPLVGRIWDVRLTSFINEQQLKRRIIDADYLLLGELHNNPVHHRHQAWVIKQLSTAGRDVGIAYEMIYRKQGEQLTGLEITSADQLIEILNQTQTGWDYKNQYRPLFVETLAADYRIVAANPGRKQLMQILKQDEERVTESFRYILDNTPFTDAQRSDLLNEINASHCNLLDSETSSMMLQGQRIRDAVLTESLLSINEPVKVLIAGLGHVRKDRGVPFYLGKNLEEPAGIFTVGMIEVDHEETDPAAYARAWSSDTLPFDIVIFTPTVEQGDYCAELETRFKKKQ